MFLPTKSRIALAWKFTFSISVLIVLTSVSLGWFLGRYGVELIKSGLMERGRSLARNLAYNGEYGVLIANQRILQPLVDGVIKEEDVLYAVIQNDEREALVAARSLQLPILPPKTVERKELRDVSWQDPTTRAYQIHWEREIFYEITFPVKTREIKREREEIGLGLEETRGAADSPASERTIGLAVVGMSLSQQRVNATIINIYRNVALLTGLVILAGIGVTFLLVRVIAAPVKQLAEAARQIAEGDWRSHVKIKSHDEIGDLADSFNRMADSVRQREGALREMNAQLEAASRHKSQFLANMSHDLRTPLNAIIGFSGILFNAKAGKVSAEEQREFLGNILSSGKELLVLINEILDLSKLDAGRETLEQNVFSVPDILESVRQTLEPLAHEKGIALGISIDPALAQLSADEVKFKRILFNLLSNAIKFTPDAGTVRVEAQAKAGRAEFAVRDNGIGIKPEDRDRIFQEFEQIETSDGRRSGTGLGLALAKRFVELHGGNIWLDSAVGQGSTFTFTIPLKTPPDRKLDETNQS